MHICVLMILLCARGLRSTLIIDSGIPIFHTRGPSDSIPEKNAENEAGNVSGQERIVTNGNPDQAALASEPDSDLPVNCDPSMWYRTKDGRLLRCTDPKEFPESSLQVETANEAPSQTHYLLPGLPSLGVTIWGQTRFPWSQAENNFGNPSHGAQFDDIHILKPVAHNPIQPIIKPIEIKPVILKPVIMPIHKPLVLKPVVYKPVIKPIHKPLVIKPIVHKPIVHKPIDALSYLGSKPLVHFHIEKPATNVHITVNKPHKVRQPAQGVNIQSGFGELHQTGHDAVYHETKDTTGDQPGIMPHVYSLSPVDLLNLYTDTPYDQPAPILVKENLPVHQTSDIEEQNERRPAANETASLVNNSSAVDSKVDAVQPSYDNDQGKTIPALQGVIDNLRQNLQRIPALLNSSEPLETKQEKELNITDQQTELSQLSSANSQELERIANVVIDRDSVELTTPASNFSAKDQVQEYEIGRTSSPQISVSILGESSVNETTAISEMKSHGENNVVTAGEAIFQPSLIDENLKSLSQGPDVIDEAQEEQDEIHIRRNRDAPGIPIDILQDQQRSSGTILDRNTLLEIMSSLKEQYLKNAEPDQRKLIEDAFDRLHCSVRDMKKLDERSTGKKIDGPKKAALKLLAERAQPLVEEPDYYSDATDDVSAEPSFLELLNVATKHKGKQAVDGE